MMKTKDLMELIAKLHIKDENGEILRVKRITVKHYKDISRAKTYFRKFFDSYSEMMEALEELREYGITWRFAINSYYGNEYLELYIFKLLDEKPKVITNKPKIRIAEEEDT